MPKVRLNKAGKPSGEQFSKRAICLLSTIEKLSAENGSRQ